MASKISVTNSISSGFRVFRANFWPLIGVVFLVNLFSFFLNVSIDKFREIKQGFALGLVLLLLGTIFWAIEMVLSMGVIKFFLRFIDGEKGELKDLYSCYRLFFKFISSIILYGLIVLGGLILFIIPGIIWACQFIFAPYLVIDKKLGPVAALKESARITQGNKWKLFLLFLILGLAVFALIIVVALAGFLFFAPIFSLGIGYLSISLVAFFFLSFLIAVFILIVSAFQQTVFVYTYRLLSSKELAMPLPQETPSP